MEQASACAAVSLFEIFASELKKTLAKRTGFA